MEESPPDYIPNCFAQIKCIPWVLLIGDAEDSEDVDADVDLESPTYLISNEMN